MDVIVKSAEGHKTPLPPGGKRPAKRLNVLKSHPPEATEKSLSDAIWNLGGMDFHDARMAILLVDSDSNGLVRANVAPMDALPGDDAFGSIGNAESTSSPGSSSTAKTPMSEGMNLPAWLEYILSSESKEENATVAYLRTIYTTQTAWLKYLGMLYTTQTEGGSQMPQSQPLPPVSEGINNTNRSPSQGQDTKTLAQAATLLLDSAQLSADATTLFKTSSTPTPQSMQQPLPLVDLTQSPSSRSEVLLSPEAHAQDGTAGISIHDDKFGASKIAVQPPAEKKNQ